MHRKARRGAVDSKLTRPLAMSSDQLDEALLSLLCEPELPFGPDTSLLDPPPPSSLIDPWDDLWTQVLPVPDAVESDESTAAETTTAPSCAWPHAQYAPSSRKPTTRRRIQTLKVEVERLQVSLEAAREKSKYTELTTRLTERGQTSSSSLAGGMWKPIAARQQQWREQAEAENAHLRSLVFAQQRHLQNVHRLLSRRPHRHVSLDDDASDITQMGTHSFACIVPCRPDDRK